MGSIPFAFSVHHFINSVGADVGFASIIGLAILVLLYFAQARETATLREQAYESAQRLQQLEGRLAQLGRSQAPAAAPVSPLAARPASAVVGGRAVANPVPAAGATGLAASAEGLAPAPTPVPAPALAGAPAPPAGVGAPALTAATKLIPTSAAASAPSTATPDAPSAPPLPAAPSAPAPVDASSSATPPPATVAAGANGTARERVPAPVAASQAPAQPPPIQIRPAGTPPPARRPPLPPRGGAPRGRESSSPMRIVLLLAGALVLAGAVAALLILTSSGGNQNPTSTGSRASNAPVARHRSKPAAFNPSSVTVAVLNGTATSGLAHRVAVKLGGAGYKQGTIATAADQTRTATVVAYMPSHKRDALAVAATLKLGSASVQAVDQNTQAVACPPPSACAASVVVTVGSDLASTQ